MDARKGEIKFLTSLSNERYQWKNKRCRLVWESECGKIIHGSRAHDFYCYDTQDDYDSGNLCAFFKSLGEAKRFFMLRELK